MTCRFCNKDFVRLKQHLKIKHGVLSDSFEPDTLKSFVLLLSVLPISQAIMRQQYIIDDYLKGKADLPRDLYCEIDRCFSKYKKRKDIKPVLSVGQIKKLKRSRKIQSAQDDNPVKCMKTNNDI